MLKVLDKAFIKDEVYEELYKKHFKTITTEIPTKAE
jgi:hypothetical protein